MRQRLRQFQVDAFASEVFRGNPAAVVLLDDWLPDDLLQSIAIENAYSETAFLKATPQAEADYHLRWFTPGCEVDLCGHATLASAHTLFAHLDHASPDVGFQTRSGILTVERADAGYAMDFPAGPTVPVDDPAAVEALGTTPVEVRCSTMEHLRRMIVLESEAHVRAATPDLSRIREDIPGGCLLITAPGDEVDFVSRFFAPYCGIDEDPVTGSAHCMLAPYWAERLGRNDLRARQLSQRGGAVGCQVRGDRVRLLGEAVTFLDGWIHI